MRTTPRDIVESCIGACEACANACDHCAAACLSEGAGQEMRRCIALDIDCAHICRLTAGYLARHSEFAKPLCAACAGVSEACAKECAKHEREHCRACVQACSVAAAQCRAIASAE
jgi:hypothetical protein